MPRLYISGVSFILASLRSRPRSPCPSRLRATRCLPRAAACGTRNLRCEGCGASGPPALSRALSPLGRTAGRHRGSGVGGPSRSKLLGRPLSPLQPLFRLPSWPPFRPSPLRLSPSRLPLSPPSRGPRRVPSQPARSPARSTQRCFRPQLPRLPPRLLLRRGSSPRPSPPPSPPPPRRAPSPSAPCSIPKTHAARLLRLPPSPAARALRSKRCTRRGATGPRAPLGNRSRSRYAGRSRRPSALLSTVWCMSCSTLSSACVE